MDTLEKIPIGESPVFRFIFCMFELHFLKQHVHLQHRFVNNKLVLHIPSISPELDALPTRWAEKKTVK